MTDVAYVDNTVLSNFGQVDRLDLVDRLQPPACTTESVLAEYAAGVARGTLSAGAWPALSTAALGEAEWRVAIALPAAFGPGERTSLALAVQRRGILATDDLDARGAAQRLGVPVTGTVGMLAACVRQGLLKAAAANTLLARMIAAGYRAPVQSLDAVMNP